MKTQPAHQALTRLVNFERLWLFLDYDGTLAEFAPSPDIVIPDPELLDLLTRLANKPDLRLAVISGRRLQHIRKLVPIPEIWLAGTYGIELLSPSGRVSSQLNFGSIRPALEKLKPKWETLIASQGGFYIEDKGWSLALHARFASDENAEKILAEASRLARQLIQKSKLRLLGGHKFLEICPTTADKGKAVQKILAYDAFSGALPIFIGDDDKDEGAFAVVKAHHGIAILVATESRKTQADYYLDSPYSVRGWLQNLLQFRSRGIN